MSRIIKNRHFDSRRDRGGTLYCDIVCQSCYFDNCSLSITDDVTKRTVVRNVSIINCKLLSSTIENTIVEDCIIDGLRTENLVQTWGAVFKHVTLKGKIGQIMLSPVVDLLGEKPDVQVAFDKANSDYYQNVDWALDISQGEFQNLDIRGIAARLIRRDPETQIVITRARAEAMNSDLKKIKFPVCKPGFSWGGIIRDFLQYDTDEDIVLVAAKGDSDFKAQLKGIHLLRKAGIAEPD